MKKLLLVFFSILLLNANAIQAGKPDLYIRSAYNSWEANDDSKMTKDNGIYTKTFEEFSGEFKIANSGWDEQYNFGGASEGIVIVPGTPLTLIASNSSSNLKITPALENVTFEFDLSTKVLTVTGTVAPERITVTYNFCDPSTFTPATPFEWVRDNSSKKNDFANIMGNPLKAADAILLEGANAENAGTSNKTRIYRQNAYVSTDNDAELAEDPWASTQLRAYNSASGYLAFTTLPGYVIKSVEFTPNGSGYQNDLQEVVAEDAQALGTFTAGTGTAPSKWVLNSGAEAPTYLQFNVTTTGKKQVRISAITLVLEVVEIPFIEEPLYLTGDMTAQAWVPGQDDWKFTTTDNETYTLEGKAIPEGKVFKITGANWDVPSYSTSNVKMLMKEYDCPEAAGENTNMGFAGAVDNLKIVFNKTTKKVTFSGNITLPAQDMPSTLFIIGEVSNHEWAPSNGVEMEKSGNKFTAEISVYGASAESPKGFSFVQELKLTWDQLNGYNNRIAPTADVNMAVGTPADFEFFEDGNYAKAFMVTEDGDYVVTADFASMQATITVKETWTEEPLYLTGSFNSWTPGDEAWKLTTTDNVTYTFDGKDFAEGAEFKITGATWEENPGYTTQNTKMEMDTEYDCDSVDAGSNMGFNGTATGVSMTFNKETKKVTFTGTLTPPTPPATPETLYVIGEVNGNSWAPETGVSMTKDGDVFTTEITITDAPKYFSFAVALADSWDALNVAGNRFAPETDTELSLTATGVFAPAGASAKSFFINTDGSYLLKADFSTMTASITEVGGIDNVIVDEADAEWFTLQGVRVANPEKGGIYIRVVNGKAVKIAK